jgi:hypothetical protein
METYSTLYIYIFGVNFIVATEEMSVADDLTVHLF